MVENIQKIVEEIHSAFYDASANLLKEGRELASKDVLKEASLLESLGFSNVKVVKDNHSRRDRLERLKMLTKYIDTYMMRYPKYKFIDHETVNEICNKYNLVLGTVGLYTGTVPHKNLMDIAAFDKDKVDKKDRSYGVLGTNHEMDYDTYTRYSTSQRSRSYAGFGLDDLRPMRLNENNQFMICAPVTDMDTRNVHLEGTVLVENVVYPDPIVLFPVQKGYLIITAWGPEASDESIVNEKMN